MIWIRSRWLRGSIYRLLLVWDWSSVSKPLSPKHRSTFLPLQHAATLIFSVDWFLLAEMRIAEALIIGLFSLRQ